MGSLTAAVGPLNVGVMDIVLALLVVAALKAWESHRLVESLSKELGYDRSGEKRSIGCLPNCAAWVNMNHRREMSGSRKRPLSACTISTSMNTSKESRGCSTPTASRGN